MGISKLQTSGAMKLAIGLLLAGTIVVAFGIVGAKAKPQTVSANVHVSVGGRTDTTGKCLQLTKTCSHGENECCPGLFCLKVNMVGWDFACLRHPQCSMEGEECDGEMMMEKNVLPCCQEYLCVDSKCKPR